MTQFKPIVKTTINDHTISDETYNALTIIDGILNSSRGGPGKEVIVNFRNGVPTWFTRCGTALPFTRILRHSGRSKEWRLLPGENYLLEGSSAYEALHYSRAVLEILNDNIPKFGRAFSLEDQLQILNYTRVWALKDFVAFAKYTIQWPMARYLKGENLLPVKPIGFMNHPLVFTGRIKRLLKSKLIGFNQENTDLWNAYLQGVKRGCAPVDRKFIDAAIAKHSLQLAKYPPLTWSDSVEIDEYITRLWKKFQCDKPRALEISTSASYQSKNDEGGARGFIRKLYGLMYPDSSELESIIDPIFFEGELSEFIMPDDLPYQQQLINFYQTELLDVVKEMKKTTWVTGVPLPPFNEIVLAALQCVKDVMVIPLSEPLKVRMITKGDSLRYWVARFYQKSLFKYLQRLPQLTLIGQPLDQSHLFNLLDREERIKKQYPDNVLVQNCFAKWVSGDYSAATDNVNINYTRATFEATMEFSDINNTKRKPRNVLDPNLRSVLRSVIYEQTLNYPTPFKMKPVEQQNGQLMGSVLSFPILCSINLTAYWAALEEYLGVKIKLEDLPVLINGDDILFRANSEFYSVWQRRIKMVGFSLSQGKNYIHKNILTVNSQLFTWNPVKKTFTESQYLNVGLLTGDAKRTGRSEIKVLPIADSYSEVINGASNPVNAHRRFLHYRKEELKMATASPNSKKGGEFNMFAPVSLGGLGCSQRAILIEPELNSFTPFQQKWATFTQENFNKAIQTGNRKLLSTGLRIVPKNEFTPQVIIIDHNRQLSAQPNIGPLPKDIHRFEEDKYQFPILAQDMHFPGNTLINKVPSFKDKESFRKTQHHPMSVEKILRYQKIACEIIPTLE